MYHLYMSLSHRKTQLWDGKLWGVYYYTNVCFIVYKWRDKLELKAVKDGSASYAALERKAELYEKLVKGELSDEEDKEKYCVDFFRKGMEQESEQPQASDASFTVATQDKASENDASMLFDMKFVAPGRTIGTMDNNEHKRFVR